jgi:uncharacterized heparinase superfamily protein
MLSSNNIKLDSTAFPDGGIYVMRSERIYLLAVCHQIGVNGNGPHKHNDWLSFELCVDGRPVIVDPGTYCYTGNMEMRQMFRSTRYHNTIVVDGAEQIDIHNSMFGLVNPYGELNILNWESNDRYDLLEAEHTGFCRLPSPVIHRRQFFLDKDKNKLKITDTFLGDGKHTLEWYLHLDVGIECNLLDNKAIVLNKQNPCLEIRFSDCEVAPRLKDSWVSKLYNKREKAQVIYWKSKCDDTSSILFSIYGNKKNGIGNEKL